MLQGSRFVKKGWHKKARWFLRKVILHPPTNQGQMRNLCNEIIERRHGSHSPSTTAIVSAALSLWDDPQLVGALESNPTYRSARERIQRTADHISPGTLPGTLKFSSPRTSGFLQPAQDALERQYHDVLQCPVCGIHIHCHHDHKEEPLSKNIEEDVEEFGKFSNGSV